STGLRALGIRVDETDAGATIHGGSLQGGSIDSHGDHRVAMSFAIAGLLAQDRVSITDCANVATSFPGFRDLANGCGFTIDPCGQQ
ncbi:MAG: 3-phosphoshikimate 1-carboxyvinyltransferase, partial [Dokdonella sp.]